ncbi:nifU protein, putative [Eimeria brunetti]|uniref:NifU protein, putative n=1 Tax=Eimeria brunetti TaxID=51314 RepID=U6LM65_9EIME|nr:nifU protein, putative [Eimeria brunetti]
MIPSKLPNSSLFSSLSPKFFARLPQSRLVLPQQQQELQQQRRGYSKEVHDHFFNPRNAGSFDLSDPENKDKVGTAIVGKAACGDVIKLQVKVEDGKITDARFKTFGCGSAIASSSYATELIKGKTTEEALKLRNTEIAC